MVIPFFDLEFRDEFITNFMRNLCTKIITQGLCKCIFSSFQNIIYKGISLFVLILLFSRSFFACFISCMILILYSLHDSDSLLPAWFPFRSDSSLISFTSAWLVFSNWKWRVGVSFQDFFCLHEYKICIANTSYSTHSRVDKSD